MTLASRVSAMLLKLGPAKSRRIVSELDLPVPMPDGAILYADRWYPADIERPPIVLVRSPYGRAGAVSMVGRLFAERGYQVVIQSCRGTAGSDGPFVPFRHEASDGRATFEWLERQPWFTGTVVTWGGSYLGLTQWACAAEAPPYVKAMATSVTAANAGEAIVRPGGTFALESTLRWASENSLPPVKGIRALRRQRRELEAKLLPAYDALPLTRGDVATLGRPVDFYQDWLAHDDPADAWWRAADYRDSVPDVTTPVSMVAGWYDLFLPYQLDDFTVLQQAGRSPRITIGPWAHGDMELFRPLFQDALDWYDTCLRGGASGRKPVRLQLLGTRRWAEFDEWPPEGRPATWHLHSANTLAERPPGQSQPDAYRYDPADPTPGIGGPSLAPRNKGPKDNRGREARPDVLVYTSPPLDADRTFVGPAVAHVHFDSTLRSVDIHVTLCDVARNGRSTNISTGIIRLRDREPNPDSSIAIDLWPVGCTFRAGHRLRLHVASGAHPTYARNPGTGAPLATAGELVAGEQRVFHDPGRPSRLELREVSV